jgi:hypothetical protein
VTIEELAWVPESCTLPTAQRPLRLAEFEDLLTMVYAVERVSATRLRLELRGPETLQPWAGDLAARESSCCSFFAFTITAIEPGRIIFQVDVDEPHVSVLDGLTSRATAGCRR